MDGATAILWKQGRLSINPLTMHISQMPLTPPSPQRGEGDRLCRHYTLSLWVGWGLAAQPETCA